MFKKLQIKFMRFYFQKIFIGEIKKNLSWGQVYVNKIYLIVWV